MKIYLEKLIIDIADDLRKIRREKLSISERIALEVALTKLKVIRELISIFNIN